MRTFIALPCAKPVMLAPLLPVKKTGSQAQNALSGQPPRWALAFGGSQHDATMLLQEQV